MLKHILITTVLAVVAFATPSHAAENQPAETILALDYSLQPGNENQVGEATVPTTETQPLKVKHKEPSWKEIKRLEIIYQVLNAIDAVQTVHCLSMSTCHEANPLLGRHPSTFKLIAIKAGGGALHYLAMRRTFKQNPRTARLAEYISIGFQGAVVGANMRIFF
ncbi:MAG: hypothetical protein AAB472_00575 [Patescibacteria group bacterium]